MSTPSRNERVASYANRAVSAREYGPRGVSSTSSTSGDDDTADGYAHRMKMRATWDALASDPDAYVGDPTRGRMELEGLFERLGADPRGGTCIEVGCGSGRMTAALAERFDRVLALDVSPAMIERARAAVPDERVEFRAVSGERLDGVDDASAESSSVTSSCSTSRRAPPSSPTSPSSPAFSPRAARRSSNCPCSTMGSARAPGARSVRHSSR